MGMRQHGWRFGAIAGALAAVGFLVVDGELARESIWLLTLVGSCVGVVLGLRWHQPTPEHPWWLLLTALALLAVGNAVTFPLWTVPAGRTLADLLAMLAFPLIAVAALAIARLQAPGGDRESAVDGAIVMVAMATLLAGTVFSADRLTDAVPTVSRVLTTVVAPLMMAAVTAAVLRLLFVGSMRIAASWFLVTAATASVVGRTLRAYWTAEGAYEPGLWSDVFILLAYVFVALAVSHPSSSQLTEETPPRHRRFTLARLAVLGASLMTAPLTLVIRDPGEGWSLPVLSSVVVTALVLLRVSGLIVSREAAQRALQLRAERQEGLAALGLQAIDDPDLERLRLDAVVRGRDLLDLDRLDIERCDPDQVTPGERHGTVTLPLANDGTVLVADRDEAWNDEDLAFLQALANVLTGAIERAATHELMRRQAVEDVLTGLPNRLALLDRLHQALAAQRRTGDPLAVMFLDLDGFKEVNDRYGHRAGDLVLITVAERLASMVRANDVVGRLAGDEFVVIGERTDLDEAVGVADRLMEAITRPVDLGGPQVQVGVSIGIVIAVGGALAAEHLLAQADHAMYTAKARPGSARVVVEAREHDGHEDPPLAVVEHSPPR
jgi:diguanylate cyclase (GGDEF)-like protein